MPAPINEKYPDSDNQQENAPSHYTDDCDQLPLPIKCARDIVGFTDWCCSVRLLYTSHVYTFETSVNKVLMSDSWVRN
jgi:hypothetical protein